MSIRGKLKARYDGTCTACDENFYRGDLIESDGEDGWMHNRCYIAGPPQRVEHPTCYECWLRHPPGECDR